MGIHGEGRIIQKAPPSGEGPRRNRDVTVKKSKIRPQHLSVKKDRFQNEIGLMVGV